MKTYYTFASGAVLALQLGCQTTASLSRIDKDKHRYEIQSQDDNRSAMQSLDDSETKHLIEKLEEHLSLTGSDLNTYINLSQAYLAAGKLDKAEESCRSALKIDLKNNTARKILAQVYYRRNNMDMAKIILNGIDAEHSKDSQVLNLLGLIALKQNNPEDAMMAFQEALKLNASEISVRMNLGVLFVQYRQLPQAAIEFERVLKLMPNHADANLHLAIIEASRGNSEKAYQLYKNVLNVSKNNPIALYNLAVLENRRKNYDKAVDYLKTYLATNYAKKKNNQEVFAMIDHIRTEQEALTGKRVSDSEIMKLAAKREPFTEKEPDTEFQEATTEPDKSPATGEATKANNNTAKTESKQAPVTEQEKKNAPSKRVYGSEEEEMQDLENQLK